MYRELYCGGRVGRYVWIGLGATWKCKHALLMREKNSRHNMLFHSAQHATAVTRGNAVRRSDCLSLCGVKRTCHNEKQNHQFIDRHLVQLPSRKTMRRDYITHNLIMKSCHITPKWNRHLCYSLSALFLEIHNEIVQPGNLITSNHRPLANREHGWGHQARIHGEK